MEHLPKMNLISKDHVLELLRLSFKYPKNEKQKNYRNILLSHNLYKKTLQKLTIC